MTAPRVARTRHSRVRTVHLLFAVLGAVVVLQAVTGRLGTWRAVIPLALGWLTWMAVRRAGHVTTPLRAYVLVLSMAAVVAVIEFGVGLPSVRGDEHAFYTLKLRITTPVGDHNELAAWLLVAVAFAAGARRARSPVLLLLALGLGATLSRGALIAAVVGLVLAWLLGVDRDVLARVGTAVVVAIVVVAGTMLVLDTSAPPDGPDSSAAARVDLWEVAVDDARSNPWLGVGLGGFEDTADEIPGPHHHGHNGILHGLAELGLVAGVAAAVRLPWATWVLIRRRDDRWLRAAGLGGLLLLAHDQVEALALHAVSEVVIGGLMALAARPEAKSAGVSS